nr:endoplasmic reticulum protein [Cryptococcus depauperatus CBS 7855]
MANATAVTLVGATGLTGSHTLSSLLSSSHPFNVTVLTRRSLPQAASANSLTTRLYTSLFDAPTDKEPIVERGGVYVSCLGTTRAKAGGTAEQEKVDLDLNKDLAKRAKEDGAKMLILVSANGSSPHSRLFYSRIKGLLEEYVKSLSFSQTVILKPGLLLGDRQESRPAEAATRWLVGGLKKWGAPVDSLAVETEDIGACIAYLSAHPPTESLLTLGNHEIIAYAKQFHTSQGQVVMSSD